MRHLALGAEQADERVARGLEDAAAAARARGAWETAGELLEQARALTPYKLAGAARVRGMRAAEHHIHAGDRPRARALLEAILEDTPPGPTRSDALRLLAEVRFNEQGFAGIVAAARGGARGRRRPGARGRDRAGPHLRPLQPQRQRPRAPTRTPPARSRSPRRADDPTLLAQALAGRAMVDFLLGRGVDWAMVDRAVALEGGDRAAAAVPAAELDRRLPEAVDGPLRRGPRGADRAAAAGVRVGRRERPRLPAVLVRGARDRRRRPRRGGASLPTRPRSTPRWPAASSTARGRWPSARMVMAYRGDAEATRAAAAEAGEICARFEAGNPMLWVAGAVGVIELATRQPRRGVGRARARRGGARRQRAARARAGPRRRGADRDRRARPRRSAAGRADARGAAGRAPPLPRAAAGRARRPPGRVRRDRARARPRARRAARARPARCSRRARSPAAASRRRPRATRSRRRWRCSRPPARSAGRSRRATTSPASAASARPTSPPPRAVSPTSSPRGTPTRRSPRRCS